MRFSFRNVKTVNGLLIAIKNKLKALLEWMTELTEVIHDQQKLESPGDYPLLSVLMSYYDLREKERWDWSNGPRNKGGINDLKEKAAVLCFMKDHDIYSIKDFARLLNAASGKVRELESDKKAKEKRIRDIDAILDAVKTLKELNPVREKYSGIHFTKSKEKYRQEHADEMARIDKANKLLHKLNVTLPINSKTLRAESAQLRAEVEAMLTELENVKADLDEQMKIRSHVRKVLPEALTFRSKDGQKRYEDVAEEVQNQQELRELLDHTAETAIRRSEEIGQGNPTPSQIQADEQQIKNRQTKERQKNWQKGDR